ncbi:MAG TPA: NAD(P)-dependent oxidoreductase [Burkholderiales bacterium]|nr:NAD(P)-dependent oxidoreductase [Burkholderiales bacterium]
MADMKRVGFIGIGNMGAPMAANLLKAGFDLILFDVRVDVVDAFVAQHGGTGAASLRELGQQSDVVITMLPNDTVVRRVILGQDGDDCAVAGLASGTVVIDMSTSDPAATTALGEALAARAIHCVDAPVMGGVAFARDASLDIMVGGAPAIVERGRPLFDALGRKIFSCGPLGAGHALKALNNYVNACALVSLVEALTAGHKYGIPTAVMIESMQAMCTGRNHPLDKKVIPHILTRRYGSGMALQLIAKDVGIAASVADRLGAPAPLAEKCAELWRTAAGALGGTVDQTEIVRYWEEAADVRLDD